MNCKLKESVSLLYWTRMKRYDPIYIEQILFIHCRRRRLCTSTAAGIRTNDHRGETPARRRGPAAFSTNNRSWSMPPRKSIWYPSIRVEFIRIVRFFRYVRVYPIFVYLSYFRFCYLCISLLLVTELSWHKGTFAQFVYHSENLSESAHVEIHGWPFRLSTGTVFFW